MRIAILFFFCVVMVVPAPGQVKNSAAPLKGEWDFQLMREWEIECSTDNSPTKPMSLRAFPDGVLFVFDIKQDLNFIFDANGRFIRTFAKKGEGPGEIKRQEFSHRVGDKILIPDGNKIHYFSKDGSYLKSVEKGSFPATLFIDENTMISAPLTIINPEGEKGSVKRVVLPGLHVSKLFNYDIFRGGVGKSGADVVDIILPGLTPLMCVGYYKNRLYYGKSDEYTIRVADADGAGIPRFTFSLSRKPIPVSREQKLSRLNHFQAPPDALKQILKGLPDQLGFFDHIEEHKGFIYIFNASLAESREKQEADIFSPAGQYLYHGVMNFSKNRAYSYSPFGNLHIVDQVMYVVEEDADGGLFIVKYRIRLP